MVNLSQIFNVTEMALDDDCKIDARENFRASTFGGTFDSGDVPTHAIDELRSINSWVGWKYVERPGSVKPTKPPVNPHNGRGASHSNPLHWGSWKQAKMAERRYGLAGVGFVLSDKDDFTGIDLDNCRDPETEELAPWAEAVIALAETYAEVSPSGKGIRLFARGKVEGATKCDAAGIEIYGALRYLTVTENHVEGTPLDIRPAPQTLEMLLSRAEAMRPSTEAGPTNAPQINTTPRPAAGQGGGGDFFRNVNDLALKLLGMWVQSVLPRAKYQNSTGAYRITSKDLGRTLQEDLSLHPDGIVDHGVADMGDANQGKRSPIDIIIEHGGAPDAMAAAKWLCERMNKTPESLGWREGGERDEELARIGDEIAEALIARAAAREEQAAEETESTAQADADQLLPPAADRDELPDHLTRPPGVLGLIVDFIEASAQRPNRVLALAAAIVTMGTIIGRRVAGPTRSGTHTFLVALAPSAAGKDHPQKRAGDMLRAVNDKLVGPGEFTSQNALVRFVTGQPLSLCVLDEFGAFLSRICSPRATAWERGVTKSLREYWGSSFDTVAPMAWATCATDAIRWPALSILGASTHDEFFSALSSKEATNGFLNRFLMLSTARKVVVVDEPAADKNEIPQSIIDTLASLYGHCVGDADDPIIEKLIEDSSLLDRNRQIPISWADDRVRAEFRDLEKLALDKAENATIGELYGRTAEIALRLATIHAASRAGLRATITHEDFAWGRELAIWSANTMAREASMRLADTEAQARAKHVLRVIYEAGKSIKHRDLNRKLEHRYRNNELKDTLESLRESGAIEVRVSRPPNGGTRTFTYHIRGKPG